MGRARGELAASICQFVIDNFDSLAKREGHLFVIRAGDVADQMPLDDRMPSICGALESPEFLEQARLTLDHRIGPKAGRRVWFYYRCSNSSAAPGTDSPMDETDEQVSVQPQAQIRRHLIENLDCLAPLRRVIRAREVADSMGLRDRTAEICGVLANRQFQEEAGIELEDAVFQYVPNSARSAPDLPGAGDFVASVARAASSEAARGFGDQHGELGAGAAETDPDLSSEHDPTDPSPDCGKSAGSAPDDSGTEPAPDATNPAKGLPAVDLCLVSCVKEKRSSAAAAKDLYTSALFTKTRRLVDAMDRPWFILSAEHGLVHPEDEIAPYDTTLKTMGKDERREWAGAVRESLEPHLTGVGTVAIFAGKPYREFLVPCLRRRGIEVHVLMRKIGKQLRWLDEQWARIRT